MEEIKCEHDYRFMETTFKRSVFENDTTRYIRIDLFYCTKCLDYVTVKKEGWHERQPCWWGFKK